MKESWIKKLIELLNEYNSGWSYDDYYWPFQYWQDRDAYIYGKYYLISKEYWFIKRLVENDKIDAHKISDATYVKVNWEFYELIAGYHYNLYQTVLMLLSISDTPIDDLLLYLK